MIIARSVAFYIHPGLGFMGECCVFEKELNIYFDKYIGRKKSSFAIQNQELWDHGLELEKIQCDRNDY